MRNFLNKRKIHGISFHHRSMQRKSVFRASISSYFELEGLLFQIKSETPSALKKGDIQYFLCDQGRNEIHTHVSQCAELISKWTGIVKILERCFPNHEFLNSGNIFDIANNNDENEFIDNELEIYLSAKKLLALWKHRLFMFEMIVEAQGSLRFTKGIKN